MCAIVQKRVIPKHATCWNNMTNHAKDLKTSEGMQKACKFMLNCRRICKTLKYAKVAEKDWERPWAVPGKYQEI